MHPPTTPLFLLLPLLFPLPTLSVAPVLITHDVRIPGYAGYLASLPSGDHLTTTYCYCSRSHPLPPPPPPSSPSPNPAEEEPDQGSYFQYDYYNYHLNATFVLHRLCRANHKHDKRHCINNNRPLCVPELDGDCENNMICASFPREEGAAPRARARRVRDGGDVAVVDGDGNSTTTTTQQNQTTKTIKKI